MSFDVYIRDLRKKSSSLVINANYILCLETGADSYGCQAYVITRMRKP